MRRSSNAIAHDEDFVAWLEDQAGHLRRGETDALDFENLAELGGMARSDRRDIRNRLTVLLIHLLKCLVHPTRRSRSWIATIGEQRRRIRSIIDDSPSLRFYLASLLEECYVEARSAAADETGIAGSRFPKGCPFEIEAVLDRGWLPERSSRAKQ